MAFASGRNCFIEKKLYQKPWESCLEAGPSRGNVCYEAGNLRNEIGGGGYIMAFQLDEKTGKLSFINEQESLSPEPAYVYLDKSERFLVVCHHADPFHVTKVVKNPDGQYASQTLFDDTALVLFELNEDGSIGRAADVDITPGDGKGPDSQQLVDPTTGHIQMIQVISRLHSAVASLDGKMLAVCDKGMDKIYTYRIERMEKKLERLSETRMGVRTFPRYGVFHPQKTFFFSNEERSTIVHSFLYEANSGELRLLDSADALFDHSMDDREDPIGAQDIIIHPNGKHIYVSFERNVNLIAVLDVEEDGTLIPRQNVPCQGEFPRGLCLSPDNRFLFSGNMLSGNITSFIVEEDGSLSPTGKSFPAVSPSVIRFIRTDE